MTSFCHFFVLFCLCCSFFALTSLIFITHIREWTQLWGIWQLILLYKFSLTRKFGVRFSFISFYFINFIECFSFPSETSLKESLWTPPKVVDDGRGERESVCVCPSDVFAQLYMNECCIEVYTVQINKVKLNCAHFSNAIYIFTETDTDLYTQR